MNDVSKVKRWCSRAACGTETAAMNPMVEWHGDSSDEGTPYVLARDYDSLKQKFETILKERNFYFKRIYEPKWVCPIHQIDVMGCNCEQPSN